MNCGKKNKRQRKVVNRTKKLEGCVSVYVWVNRTKVQIIHSEGERERERERKREKEKMKKRRV